jgi:hypothetical protein
LTHFEFNTGSRELNIKNILNILIVLAILLSFILPFSNARANVTFTGTHLYWNDARITALQAIKATDSRYIAIKAQADADLIADIVPEPASYLTGDADAGQKIINVIDGSKFVVNSWYQIQDKAGASFTYESIRIASKDGNELTTVSNLTNSYTTAEDARVVYLFGYYADEVRSIRETIERFALCAYIEDDTDYADAAIDWMLSVAAWGEWCEQPYEAGRRYRWQMPSAVGRLMAVGYDAFSSYMPADNKTTIKNAITTFVGHLYDTYDAAPFSEPFFNARATLSAGVGIPALALGVDCPAGWAAQAEAWLVESLDLLPGDGSVDEGLGYAEYGGDGLIYYIEALRNMGGTNYYDTYQTTIEEMGQWFAWGTYNSYYLQVNCNAWSTPPEDDAPLGFLYLIAKEYSDSYAQQYCDTMATNSVMSAFVFRDSTLSPTALSGMGNYKLFANAGISIWRDWSDVGYLILTRVGESVGHKHPSSGEFQIYYKGKPVTVDASGYTVDSEYNFSWPSNTLTVGDDFIGETWGLTLPGAGQGKGIGDLGSARYTDLYGEVEESVSNAYKFYTRMNLTPDGAPGNPYDGYDNPMGNEWDTGGLTTWIRHTAWIVDINALVVFDRVVASGSSQINWQYHVTDTCYSETEAISIVGDVVTITKDGGSIPADIDITSKIAMVDPVDASRTEETKTGKSGNSKQWAYLQIHPTVDTTSTLFQNVIFPETTDYLAPTRVSVGNCSGSIFTNGEYKYLALFSNNGSAVVNQEIELGDTYVAADGESYNFNGTKIVASFTDYAVIYLTSGEAPTLVSIAVTPSPPPNLKVDSTRQFTATGTYSNSSQSNITNNVTWVSSNESVATISVGGLATGVAAGDTLISANMSGIFSSNVTLTVKALVSIAVTPDPSTNLGIGSHEQFTATGIYTDSSEANLTSSVTWNTSNSSVATISSGGLATGIDLGITNISANMSGIFSSNVTLTVLTPSAILTNISVTPTLPPTLAVGDTQQFVAIGTYNDNSTAIITASVVWTSSDASRATISIVGLVTGQATGTTFINASLAGITSPSVILTVLTAGSLGITSGTTFSQSMYPFAMILAPILIGLKWFEKGEKPLSGLFILMIIMFLIVAFLPVIVPMLDRL